MSQPAPSQMPGAPARWPLPFTAVLAGLTLILWLALRLSLWLLAGPEAISPGEALPAFALGLWFDVWTLGWLLAPVLLSSALLPDGWRQARAAHALRWLLLGLWSFALLFAAAAEITFWLEFSRRFDFIAVDYLLYTHEVIGNIRESYPVKTILAGLALAALGIGLILWRRLRFTTVPRRPARRLLGALLALALPAASLPLTRVEQMELASDNALAAELAGNGLFTLAAAMRRNELPYARHYRTLPPETATQVLTGLGVRRATAPATATGAVTGPALRLRRPPRHVVLISVESLSASFLGAWGDTRGLTPELDRLAAAGVRFSRAFATGTRTVRGLEALSLGTPPVPGQAIVRRPDNAHLATVGELLEHQGFRTFFFYGGYGYFDNMNAYFGGNDYQALDRTSLPPGSAPFANIWGVADEYLFAAALPHLDAAARSGAPFFAHLMTTSNHRPYTYPDGRIDIPSPGGREGAVKYSDWAIGQFIAQARTRPWFADTLFVIVADHCASAAGKTRLPPAGYHIPLIFYAPELLSPATDDAIVSQLDVPPTLLDLLGARGAEHFFGQSLAGTRPAGERAFISNYQELGYYKGGLLTVLSPGRRASAFRVNPASLEAAPTSLDTTQLAEAIAYYQTADADFRDGRLRSPDYP